MMRGDPDDPPWRVWRRRVFGAFLAAALLIGLFLSFRPSGFDSEEVASQDEATEEPRKGSGEKADGDEPPDAEPTEEASEDPPSTETDELIDNARAPEKTSVQVLDAGGGSTAADDVEEALLDLGYDVVAVNSSGTDYDVTTVLYTEGSDAEAEALRARDERFAQIAPNKRLSDAVDLHVVVGPDWAE